MDTWRHTQGKHNPCNLTPSVHSSTTPKQHYLYTQADIPSVDRIPLMDAKCTYPYYTKRVLPINKGTQSSPLIDPMCTESYHTKTVLPINQGTQSSSLIDPCVWSPTTPQQYYLLTRAHGCHLNQPQV